FDACSVAAMEGDTGSCLYDVADGFYFGVRPYRIRDEQVREPVGREMGRLVAGIAHHAAEPLVVEDISEYVPTPDGFRCDPYRKVTGTLTCRSNIAVERVAVEIRERELPSFHHRPMRFVCGRSHSYRSRPPYKFDVAFARERYANSGRLRTS